MNLVSLILALVAIILSILALTKKSEDKTGPNTGLELLKKDKTWRDYIGSLPLKYLENSPAWLKRFKQLMEIDNIQPLKNQTSAVKENTQKILDLDKKLDKKIEDIEVKLNNSQINTINTLKADINENLYDLKQKLSERLKNLEKGKTAEPEKKLLVKKTTDTIKEKNKVLEIPFSSLKKKPCESDKKEEEIPEILKEAKKRKKIPISVKPSPEKEKKKIVKKLKKGKRRSRVKLGGDSE